MRFEIFYIWIHFFFVSAQDIFGYGGNSNFGMASNHKRLRRSIEYYEKSNTSVQIDYTFPNLLTCQNKAKTFMVIQTAINMKTRLNVPVKDNVMAIVHLNCHNSSIASFLDGYRYLIFTKFCEYQYETNYRFFDRFKTNWMSLERGIRPVLNINIALNESYNPIKLVIENCGLAEKEMKESEIEIDLTKPKPNDITVDDYIIKYSIPSNLSLFPIRFNISSSNSHRDRRFNNLVPDINLFIHKKVMVACTNDNKINGEYCSHLCQYNFRQLGEKCTMTINKTEIELLEEPQYCHEPGKFVWGNLKIISGSICEYYKAKGYNLCKYFCVDLVKCRYMCVTRSKDGFNEIGYKEFFLKSVYPYSVGSGNWSYETIPIEMVFFNECVQSSELCKDRLSCIDRPLGYRCLFNDDTGKCSSLKLNRFWFCPIKEYYAQQFTNILEIIQQENTTFTDKFEKLIKYYYVFFSNDKNISKSEPRPEDSFAALKMSLTLLDNIIDNILDQSTSYHQQDQKTGNTYVYAAYVDETAKEVSIPLSNQTSDDKNQFVKLIFKDTANQWPRNKLRIKFIRYSGMDMMGESDKLKSKMNTTNLEIPDSKDIYDNQVFYKNSDTFTLVINENRSVSVQYKIKTIYPITQSKTWLYRFEEKCAYLDESSIHWRWSTKGCRKVTTSISNYCECDHLSNFAVIFSMKLINKIHLDIFQYLSIIGGIINIISLMLFLIFILAINPRDQLRLDQLNIALCLLLGTIVFLFGGLSVKNEILCKLAALTAQFLFLSAFVWKLIFGINVVRTIASLRQENEEQLIKYRVVALVISYSVPLLIVVMSGYLYWSSYGKVTDSVCWIGTRTSAYLTFIIPIGIILAINLFILFFIAGSLFRNRLKTTNAKVKQSKELIVFFQLFISMSITWVPSYFATVYIPAMYLLIIFFPLQGLLMFLIMVIMNQENRRRFSSFFSGRSYRLISKSTLGTDSKIDSKFRSKSSEQDQGLLSGSNIDHKKDRFQAPIPMVSKTDQAEKKTSLRHPAY